VVAAPVAEDFRLRLRGFLVLVLPLLVVVVLDCRLGGMLPETVCEGFRVECLMEGEMLAELEGMNPPKLKSSISMSGLSRIWRHAGAAPHAPGKFSYCGLVLKFCAKARRLGRIPGSVFTWSFVSSGLIRRGEVLNTVCCGGMTLLGPAVELMSMASKSRYCE